MRVRVKCTYFVEVDYPDDFEDDGVRFLVEGNGCPGTGSPGLQLEEAMECADNHGVCWACNLGGQNEIVSIDRSVKFAGYGAKPAVPGGDGR